MTYRRGTVDSAVLLSKLDQCEISGCCGVVETFVLLVCCAAWVGWSPTFRESLPYVSLRVKIWTLEDGTGTLSRNVTILTLTDEICTLSRNVSTNQPTLCINPKEQKSEGGSSGNALDLYSRNTRFKSWLGHCPFWGFFFSFSAALLGKCLDISSN
jgi:hypothetical protein